MAAEPVHDLGDRLEAARSEAIEALAAKQGSLAFEEVQKIAFLQAALTAVREAIESHGIQIGYGSERPLK
jgi:hypothetical protein